MDQFSTYASSCHNNDNNNEVDDDYIIVITIVMHDDDDNDGNDDNDDDNKSNLFDLFKEKENGRNRMSWMFSTAIIKMYELLWTLLKLTDYCFIAVVILSNHSSRNIQ